MSEDQVQAALQALREADQDQEAGPVVEIRLAQAFRRRQLRRLAQKRWQRAGMFGAAAAAAAILVILLRPVAPPSPIPAPPVEIVRSPEPEPVPQISTPVERIARPVMTKPRPVQRSLAPPRNEIATEFFPLMDVPPPFERGQLVRVTVPASTMQAVGLPVGLDHMRDPVQADILVGQEGLPRAIRFVSFQQ